MNQSYHKLREACRTLIPFVPKDNSVIYKENSAKHISKRTVIAGLRQSVHLSFISVFWGVLVPPSSEFLWRAQTSDSPPSAVLVVTRTAWAHGMSSSCKVTLFYPGASSLLCKWHWCNSTELCLPHTWGNRREEQSRHSFQVQKSGVGV